MAVQLIGHWTLTQRRRNHRLMGCFSSKVAPDDTGEVNRAAALDRKTWPDILKYEYTQPIQHINPLNPWLPLLTPSQLVEINSSFKFFDKDGNGHITLKEFGMVVKALGLKMTTHEIKELTSTFDTDGNGMIEFDEFLRMMAPKMLRDTGEWELDRALALFDQKNSGVIDLSHVRDVLTNWGTHPLSKDECDSLLGELGESVENGRVSMTTLRSMACWRVPSREELQQAEVKSTILASGGLITIGSENGARQPALNGHATGPRPQR